MAAVNLNNYDEIDEKTKYLIFGFIRDAQKLFPSDVIFYNIPTLINYLCALFYFVKDEWDETRIAAKYKILQDKVTLESSNETEWDDESSACMKNIAYSGKHHWKFKIIKWPKSEYIIIGIIKNDPELIEKVVGTFLGGIPNSTYCLDLYTTELNVHEKYSRWNKGYGVEGNEGDIIDMYLDLDKLELSYAINGKYYGKAFDIDDGHGYIAAVSFRYNDVSMTLLTYDSNTYHDETSK